MIEQSKQPLAPLPYVSYRTFELFIREMAQCGLPDVCDGDTFASFNRTARVQLAVSLRRLGLISRENASSTRLRRLIAAYDTPRFGPLLREILEENYTCLKGVDLSTATPSQFADALSESSSSEEVQRKVQLFYLKAASAAGMNIGQRLIHGRINFAQKHKASSDRSPKTQRATSIKRSKDQDHIGLMRELVRKFPDFDPNWSEQVQLAWLVGFGKLSVDALG